MRSTGVYCINPRTRKEGAKFIIDTIAPRRVNETLVIGDGSRLIRLSVDGLDKNGILEQRRASQQERLRWSWDILTFHRYFIAVVSVRGRSTVGFVWQGA